MRCLRLLILCASLFALANGAAAAEGIAARSTMDDPKREGWGTEVLQQQVSSHWQAMADSLAAHRPPTADAFTWVSPTFRGSELRPSRLTTAYRDGAIRVMRGPGEPSPKSIIGIDGLLSACLSLRAIGTDDFQHLFKVYRVIVGDDRFVTHQRVALSAINGSDRRELHAVWIAEWTLPTELKPEPKLTSLEVTEYEETVSDAQPRFRDCSEAVFGHNRCYRQQLSFSIDHWSNRVLQVDSSGMQGCAVGDVNGDGLEDLYVCQASWLPNRLFIQTEDGRAEEVSSSANVDWHEQSHGALIVDLDNDGDQDLAVSTTLGLLLMENDGRGIFSLRHTAREASGAYSIAAADYDLDGHLDIFCCVYIPRAVRRQILAVPVPIHDARNGGRNVLLRNAGNWQFNDVTRTTGLEPESTRRSFACSWEDYDNDGDSDLYVANDYGRNNLFRNDDGKFTNVASQAGVEDQSFGMSSDWADTNRDGWMDLYVANMFSAAGNRIVYQPQFRSHDSADARASLQYMARGNSLFQNQANGTFRDSSHDANVMVGLWSWSCPFVDVNNDGNEDLLVANGYYSRTDTHDL